jgi:hypothetical protein
VPVEITFHANDAVALLDQVRAFCGQLHNGSYPVPDDGIANRRRDGNGNAVPDDLGVTYPWRDGKGNIVEPTSVFPGPQSPLVETDPVADTVVKKKKTGAKKAEKVTPPISPPAEPEPQPEPLGEPSAPDWLETETVNGEPEPGPSALTLDPISAEKLKAEVIAKMQDWFAAGRVKLIREVLEKYGDGAKSFPEIPAERFVKIDQAIKSGEIA